MKIFNVNIKKKKLTMFMIACIVLILLLVYTKKWSQNFTQKKTFYTQFDKFVNKSYIINLKRRPERFKSFMKSYNKNKFNFKVEKYHAVDGSKLDIKKVPISPTGLKDLEESKINGYRTKHYQLTPGAIGCYMSHVNVWKQIKDSDGLGALVFEDDSILDADFVNKTEQILEEVNNVDPYWDILFLGGRRNKYTPVSENLLKVHKFYELHAYIIRKKAITKLLTNDLIFPIEQQIDSLLSDKSDVINMYIVKKNIVNQGGSHPTDIQSPFKKVNGMDIFSKIKS